MELWYRNLGFYSNPFSIKPGAFHDEIVGYNLTEMLNKIETGKIQYVRATYGSGKTTMLKHIVRQFGGRRMVAYFTCNISEGRMDTKRLLTGRSFFNRAFGVVPKGMILLVDEAQDITFEEAEEIAAFYKDGSIKAIVFFGTDIVQKNLPKFVSRSIRGNIISLSTVSPEKAVEIIRKRIGRSKILSDEMIKRIYALSGFNPRRMLENCEDACKFAAGRQEKTVREAHIRELFRAKAKPVAKPKIKPKKVNVALVRRPVNKARKKQEPIIKIRELDAKAKPDINLKFDYSNIRSYEEEMAFGKNL